MAHERPAPAPFDDCLCLSLRRAARLATRRYDQALAAHELTSGQFSLLGLLASRPGLSQAALAERLAMDRTTVTAALKPLERRGLVTLGRDEKDARAVRMAITAKGLEVLKAAMPSWRRVQRELTELFGARDSVRMREDLARLR